MTRVVRLTVIGLALTAVLFVAGYAFIPTRLGGSGAGSVRCGTALRPDRESEVRHRCPGVGRERLEDTLYATALFALVAVAPAPLHRWIEHRPPVRSVVTGILVAFWLIGTPLTLFVITRSY